MSDTSVKWTDYFAGPFRSDNYGTFIFGWGIAGCGQQMMAEVLELRGWGYLNGVRCSLPEAQAVEIQKQIQAVILAALNAEWEKGREG